MLAGKKKYPTNNDSSEKADLKRQIQVYKKKKKKGRGMDVMEKREFL